MPSTRVERDKKAVTVRDLQVGQSVVVDATGDSISELAADKITIVPPPRR